MCKLATELYKNKMMNVTKRTEYEWNCTELSWILALYTRKKQDSLFWNARD